MKTSGKEWRVRALLLRFTSSLGELPPKACTIVSCSQRSVTFQNIRHLRTKVTATPGQFPDIYIYAKFLTICHLSMHLTIPLNIFLKIEGGGMPCPLHPGSSHSHSEPLLSEAWRTRDKFCSMGGNCGGFTLLFFAESLLCWILY